MIVPLKQGLKLEDMSNSIDIRGVEMIVPLKQGLKHFTKISNANIDYIVEMIVPLKQGLKQIKAVFVGSESAMLK